MPGCITDVKKLSLYQPVDLVCPVPEDGEFMRFSIGPLEFNGERRQKLKDVLTAMEKRFHDRFGVCDRTDRLSMVACKGLVLVVASDFFVSRIGPRAIGVADYCTAMQSEFSYEQLGFGGISSNMVAELRATT